MDAITLDGDLCSRKGALTGGFVDQSKSRLHSHMVLKRSEDALKRLENEHREMKDKTTAVDQQVSNIMGEVQRLEAKHANLDHLMSRIEEEAGKLEKTTERHSKQIRQIEEEIPPMETEITSFDGQMKRLQDEIGVSTLEGHIPVSLINLIANIFEIYITLNVDSADQYLIRRRAETLGRIEGYPSTPRQRD